MLNKYKILTVFSLFTTSLAMAQGAPTSAGTPAKAVADKIVAVVGDRIILQSEITNSIKDAERQGGTVPENVDPGAAQEMLIVQNKCGNGTKFAHDAMDLFIDEEKGLWILSDHAIRKGRIRKPDRLSNQINF